MHRVPGKLHDRICRRMEKQGAEFPLVGVDQGIQFSWTGKYQMVILYIQNTFPLCVDPQFIGKRLAHRAGSVTAGIVMDLYMAALAASGNIYPIRTRLAVQNVGRRLCLSGIGSIFLQVPRVKLPQDILDSWITCHRRRPPCCFFHRCQTDSLSP